MRIFITGGAGFIGTGEMMFSIVDISLAKENLNLNPKISLKYGLEQFLFE